MQLDNMGRGGGEGGESQSIVMGLEGEEKTEGGGKKKNKMKFFCIRL